MVSLVDVKKIAEEKFGRELISCEDLKSIGAYGLIFNIDSSNPHDIPTLPSVIIIYKETGNIDFLDMLDYFDVLDNEGGEENIEKIDMKSINLVDKAS